MKLRTHKRSFILTIPHYMVEYLLWEKGDDISLRLDQANCHIELFHFDKQGIKQELFQRDQAEQRLNTMKNLDHKIRAHEEKIALLKKEKAEREAYRKRKRAEEVAERKRIDLESDVHEEKTIAQIEGWIPDKEEE